MKKINENTQKLIISSYNQGKSLAKIAKKFSVSRSTVFRILKKMKLILKVPKMAEEKYYQPKKKI
jgi:DNA-directed RNA polymerase specialized sigma subunit